MEFGRVKVEIDGLKPLVFDRMVQFGENVQIPLGFEYGRLVGFCTACFSLCHDSKSYPLLDTKYKPRVEGSTKDTSANNPHSFRKAAAGRNGATRGSDRGQGGVGGSKFIADTSAVRRSYDPSKPSGNLALVRKDGVTSSSHKDGVTKDFATCLSPVMEVKSANMAVSTSPVTQTRRLLPDLTKPDVGLVGAQMEYLPVEGLSPGNDEVMAHEDDSLGTEWKSSLNVAFDNQNYEVDMKENIDIEHSKVKIIRGSAKKNKGTSKLRGTSSKKRQVEAYISPRRKGTKSTLRGSKGVLGADGVEGEDMRFSGYHNPKIGDADDENGGSPSA